MADNQTEVHDIGNVTSSSSVSTAQTSRQIAKAPTREEGKEIAYRRMSTEIVKHLVKALHLMANAGGGR